MARPRKQIDTEQVRKLAAIGCSISEIASVMNIHRETLSKRYSTEIQKGRDEGRITLRRKMFEAVQKGNVTMMIFLSKQACFLGYSDKTDLIAKDPEHKDESFLME